MRNQNYITNKKIIEEVKKNQKDYVEPEPIKKDLTLSATAEPIEAGDEAIVIVTGLETATGNITVTIDEETYTGTIEDGEATVTIPDLTETTTVTVNYAGDENYKSVSTTVEITVENDGPGGTGPTLEGGDDDEEDGTSLDVGDLGDEGDDEGPIVSGPTLEEHEIGDLD